MKTFCDECGCELDSDDVIVMEKTLATDESRSNGNDTDSYKSVCNECAWELFESGEWEKM